MENSPSWSIHLWSIKKFSWYLPEGPLHWTEYIESKPFKPKNTELAFYLHLYPRGKESNNRDYASLVFGCAQACLLKDINLKLTFVIEDTKRQKRFKVTADHSFDQNQVFVCKQFIRLAELDQDKEYLLPNDTLTIWCSIQEEDGQSKFIKGIDHDMSVKEPNLLSHKWTIESFTDYLNDGKMKWRKGLKSKTFTSRCGSIKFHLHLYPNGSGVVDSKDHLSIFLHLESQFKDHEHVKFNWAFSLLDEHGTRRNMESVMGHQFTNGWNGFGYQKLISHVDLKDSTNKYLSQNKLTIVVDIEDVGNERILELRETSSCTAANALAHIWTITNFSALGTGWAWKWGLKSWIESKPFATSNGKAKFYLRLEPNSGEKKDHMALYFMACDKSDIVFNCSFAIFGKGVKRILDISHKLDIGSSKFISRAELFDSKNGYLSNDTLVIYCGISDPNDELIVGYTETGSKTTDGYYGF